MITVVDGEIAFRWVSKNEGQVGVEGDFWMWWVEFCDAGAVISH
jgi:hypothetical protein